MAQSFFRLMVLTVAAQRAGHGSPGPCKTKLLWAIAINLPTQVGFIRMQATVTVAKTSARYGRPSIPSQRLKTLDLLIKTLVPVGLLVSLWVAWQIGSLDGYARLITLKSFHTPLLALGA